MNLRIRLLTALLLLSARSYGQNLVPNPSFESYTSCPVNQNQLSLASPWFNPSTVGSPDYYNACSPVPQLTVPFTGLGYQPAFTGNAYAGLYLWGAVVVPEVREFLEAPLTTALAPDRCYRFSMRVNLANVSEYTTRSIGVYFSDTMISGVNNFYPLPVQSQIVNTAAAPFDTSSWTLVSGDYRAHGGERYIVIGNFKVDAATDTSSVNPVPGTGYIYVFVDSVSLLAKNCDLGIGPAAGSVVTVAPNPFTDRLLIRMEPGGDYELAIIGGAAGIVYRAFFSGSLEINTAAFPQGLYFYEVKGRNGELRRGKLLKL